MDSLAGGESGAEREAVDRIQRLVSKGKYSKALEKCRRALARNGESPALRYQLIELLAQLGHGSEAKAAAVELADSQCQWAAAQYMAGVCHLLSDDWAPAEAYLTKALTLQPDLYQARKVLADVYLRMNDLSRASQIVEAELQIYAESSQKMEMEKHIGGVLATKAFIMAQSHSPEAVRASLVEWLLEHRHHPCLLVTLLGFNPPTTPVSQLFHVMIEGKAPLMNRRGGAPSMFMQEAQVIADSEDEALGFLRELERLADPASLRISACKRRKLDGAGYKGVVMASPSFSMEIATEEEAKQGPVMH